MAVLYNSYGKIIFQAKWKNQEKQIDVSDGVLYFEWNRGIQNHYAFGNIRYLRPHEFIKNDSKRFQTNESFEIQIQFHYGLNEKTFTLEPIIHSRSDIYSVTAMKEDQLKINDLLLPKDIDKFGAIVSGYYENSTLSDVFDDLCSQAGIVKDKVFDEFDFTQPLDSIFIPKNTFLNASLHLLNKYKAYNSIYCYYMDDKGLVITKPENSRSAKIKVLLEESHQKEYASGFEVTFTRGVFLTQQQYDQINISKYEDKKITADYKNDILGVYGLDLGRKTVSQLTGVLPRLILNMKNGLDTISQYTYQPYYEYSTGILVVNTTSMFDFDTIKPFSVIEVEAHDNISYLSGKWLLVQQKIVFDFTDTSSPFYMVQSILVKPMGW